MQVIGDIGWVALAAAIRRAPDRTAVPDSKFTGIMLPSQELTSVGLEHITSALFERNHVPSQIQKIHLVNNKIGDAGFVALAAVLRGCSKLKSLLCRGNQCGETGLIAILASVRPSRAPSLKAIDFSENMKSIGPHGVKNAGSWGPNKLMSIWCTQFFDWDSGLKQYKKENPKTLLKDPVHNKYGTLADFREAST
jgi:hypothetical protein